MQYSQVLLMCECENPLCTQYVGNIGFTIIPGTDAAHMGASNRIHFNNLGLIGDVVTQIECYNGYCLCEMNF